MKKTGVSTRATDHGSNMDSEEDHTVCGLSETGELRTNDH